MYVNGYVQSNLVSEIRMMPNTLIISSTKTYLFLIELISNWPIIVFKALLIVFYEHAECSYLWKSTIQSFVKKGNHGQ